MISVVAALVLGSPSIPLVAPGDMVPGVLVQNRLRQAVSLKSDRVTVVSCVGYWCDTWRPQARVVADARERLKSLPIRWVGLSVDGTRQSLDPQPNWGETLNDYGSRWSNTLGIDRVPLTIVSDRTGLIRWVGYGVVKEDDLVRAVLEAQKPLASADIYLTFDDYPAPEGNEELLRILKEASCPATIFVVGENGAKSPHLLDKAQSQGHELAIHGWKHHGNPEPSRLRRWLTDRTGETPYWQRLPGSNKVVDQFGKELAGRKVDPYDFLRPGASEVRRRVLSRLAPGAVIQLHAGVRDTLEVLPQIIAGARRLGYRFAPLPRQQ